MEKAEWDYQVAVKQIETVERKDQIIDNRLATIDETSGQPLGLVSTRYRLIQNRQIHDAINSLPELGLELQNVGVFKGKRITAFKYNLKNSEVVVEGSIEPDDKVHFGIEIINSFDMGLPKQVRAFAHRLVCRNGMTVPRDIGRFSLNELGDFNQDEVRDEFNRRLTPLITTANTWREWTKIIPSRVKVGQLLSSHLPKKASEQILSDYSTGKDKTVWGLYNLVTYYITHVAKSKNQNDLRVKQWELETLANKFYTEDLN